MRCVVPALLVLSLILFSGCKREEPAEAVPVPKKKAAKPVQVMEPAGGGAAWAAKPKEEWPQMVLTNHATFKGHTPLHGASGFLLKAPTGTILVATARHLLGVNGGVEPEIALKNLNGVLESWVLHPRTRPEEVVKVAGLASPSNAPQGFDWLLLRMAPAGEGPLPATPLQPRTTPVEIGERIHLIGVSYDEPDVAQKVYSGTVTRREFDRFAYDLDTPVNIRGFSGAPIVDEAGKLVGVMTVFFEPKMDGELYLEGGGEDASMVWKVLLKMVGK